MNDSLKISLIQEKNKHNIRQNIKFGEELIKISKEKNADIVLFPECWSIGYHTDPEFLKIYENPFNQENKLKCNKFTELAVNENSEFITAFRKIAKKYEIGIALTYLSKGMNYPKNSVSLIGKKGEILIKYDKIHTYDFSIEALVEGGNEFKVCDFYGIKIGIMIGLDQEFPESARSISLRGAEVILVSSACAMNPAKIEQLSTRSFENTVGIAMSNYPQKGWGCSCAFSPIVYDDNEEYVDNKIIKNNDIEKIVSIANFNIEEIKQFRKKRIWNNKNRKNKTYFNICAEVVHENYNLNWPSEFEKIKETLSSIIKDSSIEIEHIGSTSIPGIIIAKSIIDIDVIVENISSYNKVKTKLEEAGFIYKGNFGINGRELFVPRFLNSLMNFHVYLCEKNKEPLNHIIFRDYLRQNKNEAKEYSNFKKELAKKYMFDIKSYTLAKSEFIKKILNKSQVLSDSAEYRITNDKYEIEIEQIKRILDQSYWSKGHSIKKITKYVEHSECFGVLNKNNLLIGFARAITDYTTFYYIWDFIIDENYRKRGIGKKLLEYVINYEKFKGICGALCTSSKPFYEKFGFKSRDNVFMCKD
jgi:predicted amidohydrolase/GrpB-like predicted nucleotidyltransferase (UPF0157 family)/GNAT superfamily N-acetyltransferase